LSTIEAAARRKRRWRLDGFPHPPKKRSTHGRKDYINTKNAATKRTQESIESKGAGILRVVLQDVSFRVHFS
jgi:hypothetical protein